jgi:hypothetical protein
MKGGIFIVFILAASFCKASNLIFNQVLLLKCDSTFSQTVPTGTVWEIKSVLNSSSTGTLPSIQINGQQVNFGGGYGGGGEGGQLFNVFPVWLPAGTTVASQSFNSAGFISIIEYNVTP